MLFFVLILTLLMISLISSNRDSTLVLKEFKMDVSDEARKIITIKGRKSGFIAWLLTLMNLATETSLEVNRNDIRISDKSLFGEKNILITYKKGISHITCEYTRPFKLLLLSMFILLAGFLAVSYWGRELRYEGVGESVILVPCFIISIILAIVFYFKKRITIAFIANGGKNYVLNFSPSLIENVNIDLSKAKEVTDYINWLILVNKD